MVTSRRILGKAGPPTLSAPAQVRAAAVAERRPLGRGGRGDGTDERHLPGLYLLRFGARPRALSETGRRRAGAGSLAVPLRCVHPMEVPARGRGVAATRAPRTSTGGRPASDPVGSVRRRRHGRAPLALRRGQLRLRREPRLPVSVRVARRAGNDLSRLEIRQNFAEMFGSTRDPRRAQKKCTSTFGSRAGGSLWANSRRCL